MSKIEERFLELIEQRFGKEGRAAIEHLCEAGILHEGDAKRYVIMKAYVDKFLTTDLVDVQLRSDVSAEFACGPDLVYWYLRKTKNIGVFA